ncbi:MAG: TetR/AcrR family transcriptional regulator [Opitutales bacterium]
MMKRLQQKTRTREHILRSAARVFRRKGYAAASVDEVMAGAGLTVGGFYAHFKNKDDLFQHALLAAAVDGEELLRKHLPDIDGWEGIRAYAHAYLSEGHLKKVAEGCPLPSLTADVARSGKRTKRQLQDAVEDRLARLLTKLPTGPETRAQLIGILVTLVGGLTLARGMPDADTAHEILQSARASVDRLIDSCTPNDRVPSSH